MERFKKTIKKIAAVAGGAVMVGATMAGALAALDSLPQPFVTTAGVMDSYIVVGTLGWNPNAAYNADAVKGLARDVATGIDVGAAFAQKATKAASGAAPLASFGEGVRIDAAGNDFNYGEDIEDIDATYDEEALPKILPEGTYKESKGKTQNDVDFEQSIKFADGTADIVFGVDDDSKTEEAGTYLHFANDVLYTYTLDFLDPVKWEEDMAQDDFKNSKLEIQGKTYTFSTVKEDDTNNKLDEMELLSGAVLATQGEYTTQTYTVNGKSYEVEVLIVADNANPNTVQFRINGETLDPMTATETDTLADGLEIGVDYISPNEGSEAAGADQVTFYLGAQKLKFIDGGAIEINEKELDDLFEGYDADVEFDQPTSGDNSIGGFKFNLTTDELWVGIGEEWVDPVFGQWKLAFTGLEKDTEMIKATVSGTEKGNLVFTNNNGDEVNIPFMTDDSGANDVVPGEDWDFVALTSNGAGMLLENGDTCDGAAPNDCEGILLRVISAGNEVHILEVSDITEGTTAEFDLDDLTSGKSYSNRDEGVIDLGWTTIRLDYNDATDVLTATTIDNSGDAAMMTDKGAALVLTLNSPDTEVGIDYDYIQGAYVEDDQFDFTTDADHEMQLDVVSPTAMFDEKKDADYQVGLDTDNWGAIWRFDGEDKDDLTIEYPEEEVVANVWLVPAESTSTGATSGAVNVNYINAATGIARTDADFASAVPTKNVILIGGPTVNELVSDLAAAGKTWTSAEWATKVDTAVIQLVEDAYGTNDALIIAGYDAKDTALAGKVVASRLTANQFASELKGAKVVLSTAGASTVNEVTFS